MTALPRIHFVCEGNVCRSPYAVVALTRAWPVAWNSGTPLVSSAGTHARTGDPVHPLVLDEAADAAGALLEHRSRRLDRQVLLDQDLIVTMTPLQRTEVLDVSPAVLRRTFTLGDVVKAAAVIGASSADFTGLDLRSLVARAASSSSRPATVVDDPVRGGPDEFRAMVAAVDEGVDALMTVLEHLGLDAVPGEAAP